MRDASRIFPLYNFLAKVHLENFPDWRFGQFIDNFKDWYGRDLFYLEDDVIEEKMTRFVTAMKLHQKFKDNKNG